IGQFYALAIPCGASHGCSAVALHPSSHALGVPNAYLGLALYFVVACLTFVRMMFPGSPRWLITAAYVLVAAGTLGSLVLTYYSIAVIQATCAWCLTSTATMILLLMVHALIMQRAPSDEPQGGNN